jgi:hypothetical protein
LESWKGLGETAGSFLGPIGLAFPSGEKGRSVLELIWARPTAEFNGIAGGYAGKGFKTVIAARRRQRSRSASCTSRTRRRSAPLSAPSCEERIPADCSVEFHPHGGSPAIQLSYDSPFLTKAKDALSDEWPSRR